MSKPSFKKLMILGLSNATKLEAFKGSTITLVTAAGLVKGDFSSYVTDDTAEDELTDENLLSLTAYSVLKAYSEEFEIENPTSENDGYMVLNNVQILNSSQNNIRFQELVVFFDQIIGISIGDIQISTN